VLVYKIAPAEDWSEAMRVGAFAGSAKDKEDGFIHLSTAEQLVETLRLHFRHVEDMLALVAVDVKALGGKWKWEPSRNGDLFPHLYSPLPANAVRNAEFALFDSLAEDDFSRAREFVHETGKHAQLAPADDKGDAG